MFVVDANLLNGLDILKDKNIIEKYLKDKTALI